jgi:hypothetical protein
MSETADDRVLWTAWCDYFATGEGRSIMACITYARTEDEMRAHFTEKFDEWFAKSCEIQSGVVRNKISRFIWSEAMLDAIEDCGIRRGWVDAHSWMHFNFS